MRKTKAVLIALASVVLLVALTARAAAPVRVMILDGESGGPYHKWQSTTPVLRKELEETGLFQEDVVTAPAHGADFSHVIPEFNQYQVVVLNYDAPYERWPAAFETSFEEYIREGVGHCAWHGG